MEETIIGMREMKEYVWKYGGAHSFPVTEDMIKGKKRLEAKITMEILSFWVSFVLLPTMKLGFLGFFKINFYACFFR